MSEHCRYCDGCRELALITENRELRTTAKSGARSLMEVRQAWHTRPYPLSPTMRDETLIGFLAALGIEVTR